MKIEKLRNKNSKRWFLCGLILVVVLTIVVSLKGSKAGYRSTASIELNSGTVVSSPYDFKVISMYIDGIEQDKNITIPDARLYEIDEENSYCCKTTTCNKENKDKNITLKTVASSHTFNGISKGSKCTLAFNKIAARTMQELLNNYYTNKKVRTTANKDFNVPFGGNTNQTIFITPEEDSYSYYFAGNPTDNWVLFGGYYWRIIRVNGNGSIRMIYQGKEEDGPQATGEGTQIGTSAFNSEYNNNRFVGYMYGNDGELRGLSNPSNAYTAVNSWFAGSNIKQGSAYFDKIDLDAGFCGDRTPSTSSTELNGSGGTGTTTTYYGAYLRLAPGGAAVTASTTKVTPTLTCGNKEDLYTYKNSTKDNGNKKLDNPVGMITVDEVAYAGLVFVAASSARTNYLDTQQNYWTMSPSNYGNANVFGVSSRSYLATFTVSGAYGVRPVINLKSTVTFSNGNGTASNPYLVN